MHHRFGPPGGAVVAVAALLMLAPAPAAADPPWAVPETVATPVRYDLPVPGDVTSTFAPPPAEWAAGHRGVDLLARDGTPVRSAAVGTVVFAGDVAGAGWVTVAHADGVRTSYGPLRDVRVREGSAVHRSTVLGRVTSGHRPGRVVLHWGARRGAGYVDPLALLAGTWRPALVGPGDERVTDLPDVPRYDDWYGRRSGIAGVVGLVEPSPDADGPGYVLPPNPNHVIAVAGLNSGSEKGEDQPLDLTHLGYAPEDVTYLSYGGRSDRGHAASDPRRDQLPYGAEDTWKGVPYAAELLREQLRAQWKRDPGQAVDLVAHSMGGEVVMYYLVVLHDPTDPTLPPIGHVMTYASPLEGADIANAIADARRDPIGRRVVDTVAARTGQAPGSSETIRDLAVGSAVADQVQVGWARALAERDDWRGPLAGGTQVMTAGSEFDHLVPDHRSDLAGTQHVVLPGGHTRVRNTEASRIVGYRFLGDEPVPGAPAGLTTRATSYGIAGFERAVGFLLGGPPMAWGDAHR